MDFYGRFFVEGHANAPFVLGPMESLGAAPFRTLLLTRNAEPAGVTMHGSSYSPVYLGVQVPSLTTFAIDE
jgi:hypothetical protein